MLKFTFILLFSFYSFSLSARESAIEAVDTENLRVCADPSNLPFSNENKEGYENDIANLLGNKLGIPVVYEFFPQVIGYVRNTLNKKKCDIIIGITASNDLVLNTVPYMRWSYGMFYLKDNGIEVDRPNHPQLADLSIGVQAGTPPTFVLQRYNLMGRVRPYNLTFDPRKAVIGESMIEDLIDGLIDIAFMSGPIASHYLNKKGFDKNEYVYIPLETTDQGWGKMDYYTTMGVRDGETDWKKKLNRFIKSNQKEIDKILAKHNIPVLTLRPGKRKKSEESTTDALIKGRAPVR
ncbi:MAG: quinoprotein dehydrogenase-associated putative ABC transporter substrate-binding protein [Alphaproteobacteria bacterium]|nr:quinoprotein dehydrogenase-associated putative ABC transporter substrate-binding protein [Alphaproteobacteria bacterium]